MNRMDRSKDDGSGRDPTDGPKRDRSGDLANFSMCISVAPARIDFERVDTSPLDETKRQFIENVRANKQVLYDWGQAAYFSCPEPITLDREAKRIEPYPEKGSYAGVWQHELRDMVGEAWNGYESPIAADSILTMLNSGIEVELVGTEPYGPSDPEEFMQALRQRLTTKES